MSRKSNCPPSWTHYSPAGEASDQYPINDLMDIPVDNNSKGNGWLFVITILLTILFILALKI